MEFNYNNIYTRIKNDLTSAISKIEGTFSMDNVSAVANELAKLYSMEIATIAERYSLDTATTQWLDKKGIDFNEKRHPAQAAVGTVTFTGFIGTKIPNHTEVQADELVFYTVADDVISDSGNCEIAVICRTKGTVGNINIGRVSQIKPSSMINGVTVANHQPFIGGVDIELDEPFRARILEKIRKPITSGNENHYVYWAKQVPGVGNARCIPVWAGAGTVKVIILSDTLDIPDADILEDVISFIQQNRPIGADVTVVAAEAVPVTVSLQLKLSVGVDIDAIKAFIQTALKEYLNTITKSDKSYLSYHKVGDIVFNIDGIQDIIDYSINGQKISLEALIEQFFTLEEVLIDAV